MFDFKGVGVFFNQMVDLERIGRLADGGYIDWIAPIMAPDQQSVQTNRREWITWRNRMPNVKFCPWIVCDDPSDDADRAEWVVQNYPSDGLVMNCEKSYESAGKWKGKILCTYLDEQANTHRLPKLLSYPSTPAERFDMDYRAFERAGFIFAPQAYWNDASIGSWATPKFLFDSCYLPYQVFVGRDYRLWIYNSTISPKPWGRITEQITPTTAHVKDLRSTKTYSIHVKTLYEGSYAYMVIDPERGLYDPSGNKLGKILGFQAKDKILPTVGVYDSCPTTPQSIINELNKLPTLKGASLFLGDTSTDAHVQAIDSSIA